MKTVSVSEIIRTAQLGDTKYVLASDYEEERKLYAQSYDANVNGYKEDLAAANERIKVLEEDLADMFNVGPVCLECQRKDERIQVLEAALKDALYSMRSLCQYSEDHKEEIAIVSNALEVK